MVQQAYWLVTVSAEVAGVPSTREDRVDLVLQGTREEVQRRVRRVFGDRRILGMRRMGRIRGWRRRPPSWVRIAVFEILRDFLSEGISPVRVLAGQLAHLPRPIQRVMLPLLHIWTVGASLSESLALVGFPDVEVRMIEAGESTGRLVEMLQRTIDFLEMQVQMTRTLRTLLIYPLFIVGVMGAVGWVFELLVFRELHRVLNELGTALPRTVHWMVRGLAGCPFVVAWAAVGVRLFPRVQRVLFRIWPFSRVLFLVDVVRTLLVLEASLASGESLARAFARARWICMLHRSQAAAVQMERWARGEEAVGQSIYDRLLSAGYPLDMAVILATGYETGRLEETLRRLTGRYMHKLQEMVTRVMQFLEYGLIVVLGALVGGVLVGIYTTIFEAMTRFG